MGKRTNTDKSSILNLENFLNKAIRVKMVGGREVHGILKAYEKSMNLTIDEAEEYLKREDFIKDPNDVSRTYNYKRKLGLIIAKGTAVLLVASNFQWQEISNPFKNTESI